MARGRSMAVVVVAFVALLSAPALADRVLMLLPSVSDKEQYSSYISELSQLGHQVDVKYARDSSLRLKEYDTWLYEHLILLAPKADSFGGTVNQAAILQFIDSGHNVLIAGSADAADTIANLAAEVGVDFDSKGSKVFDHFSHAVMGGKADDTIVATTSVVQSPAITGAGTKLPLLFRGVAAQVPANSELVTVVVSAPETAYSLDPRKPINEAPALMAGAGIALLAAVQARNNARVLVSGSADFFSNAFFSAEVVVPSLGSTSTKTGNKDIALAATQWLFKQRGVLVAENMKHRIISGEESPSLYRVNDDVEFSIDMFELENGRKKPWAQEDVQVEFTMLDPHVRLPLVHDGKGHFSVRFKVPDVYGVFKYVMDYRRQGYTYIALTQQVPVRPFRHDEYERFLVCAYPYYVSALSTMAAFFVLGFFFLYHK